MYAIRSYYASSLRFVSWVVVAFIVCGQRAAIPAVRLWNALTGTPVITSYSIHYTKLYDRHYRRLLQPQNLIVTATDVMAHEPGLV